MKCPRCSAAVSTPADASGLFVCPACGIRLKRVPAPPKPEPAAPAKAEVPAATNAEATPASASPGELEANEAGAPPVRSDPPRPGSATLPPGARKPVQRPDEGTAAGTDALAPILAELHALRRGQEEILALLRERPPSFAAVPDYGEPPASAMPDALGQEPRAAVRSRRRKSVLLIDDDAGTRRAALAALEQAEVPARVAEDGNAGLSALASERADVIVLELGVGGAMPGKDMINLIKATMEWVDIPIVLYTRLPVVDQKEARTIHGADELVRKDAPGSAEALVARVVALFRKG
jgi:CheY-like chemotaxis protein